MKTYRLGESSIHTRFRRRASENPNISPRETITLGDPTDCLLDAERQLLLNFPVDLQESNDFIYALASVPGATAARISIGIESRWMVILVRQPREHPQLIPASAASTCSSDALESDRSHAESKSNEQRSADSSQDDQRPTSVCVLGLPATVDGTRSIAVVANGILGIRMAKLHPAT